MPELAAMKRLRDRQAERLANAINDNEPRELIAREKKLLEGIDASLKVFNGIRASFRALNASRVLGDAQKLLLHFMKPRRDAVVPFWME
jgi:porphobilinogen deaminase